MSEIERIQAALAREQRRGAKRMRIARDVMALFSCDETLAGRAAVLLDSAGSYERAMTHLRLLEAYVARELYDVALHVRLEAHERGWINADEPRTSK